MNLEKFKIELQRLRNHLKSSLNGGTYIGTYLSDDVLIYSKMCQIIDSAKSLLPDNAIFIDTFWRKAQPEIDEFGNRDHGITKSSVIEFCDEILESIYLEEKMKESISENKTFQGMTEKIEMSNKALEMDDFPSTINNLNTALELFLKDLLDIPTTITKIKTGAVIDILISKKIGPVPHLKEIKTRLLSIDNDVKHRGFKPAKTDCIRAMKLMEEFIPRMKKVTITEATKDEIYEAMI